MTELNPDPRGVPSGRIVAVVCIVCIAAGVFFRLYGLGHKMFWFDETWTAAHAFGHRIARAQEQQFTNKLATPEEMRAYTRYNPDARLMDTVKRLGGTDTAHPPLYYGMLHFWALVFGDSPAALRSLGALFGVAAIGAMYVLCRMLFPGTRVPLVAAAAFALSPFHVTFAQEARQYSLLALMTLFSSSVLVGAVSRRDRASRWWWLAYAATVSAGMYTFPLFLFVVVAHFIYVLIERWTEPANRGVLRRFIVSAGAGGASFIPWAVVMYRCREVIQMNTGWTAGAMPRGELVGRWLRMFGTAVIDTTINGQPPNVDRVTWNAPVAALLLTVCVIGFFRARMTLARRVLVLALVAVPFAALAVPDLVLGGRRSASARYLSATMAALPAIVGVAIATGLGSRRAAARLVASAVAVVIAAAGLCSLWQMSGQLSWWNKGTWSVPLPPVVAAINASHPSRVVVAGWSDTNAGEVIALARYVDPDIRFLLLDHPSTPADVAPGGLVFESMRKEKAALLASSELDPIHGTADSLFRRRPSVSVTPASPPPPAPVE